MADETRPFFECPRCGQDIAAARNPHDCNPVRENNLSCSATTTLPQTLLASANVKTRADLLDSVDQIVVVQCGNRCGTGTTRNANGAIAERSRSRFATLLSRARDARAV